MDAIFSEVYKSGLWGMHGSRSGSGSSLEQTAVLRSRLPTMLRELRATSLLDIPCGDFFWMREVDLSGVTYIGADVVLDLIARLQATVACDGRTFRQLDLTRDPLPKVDVIFARDVLVHLAHRDALLAIANVRASGANYLATTTFSGRATNPDVATGDWRPVNLQRAPFNFPAPIELINEGCTEGGGVFADKSIGVWRIADLHGGDGS